MPTEIDPRLLEFLPFYKALFLRNNPNLRGRLTDEVAQEGFVSSTKGIWSNQRGKEVKRSAATGADKALLEILESALTSGAEELRS